MSGLSKQCGPSARGTDLPVSADKVAVQEILVSTLSSLKFESDSLVRLVCEGRATVRVPPKVCGLAWKSCQLEEICEPIHFMSVLGSADQRGRLTACWGQFAWLVPPCGPRTAGRSVLLVVVAFS